MIRILELLGLLAPAIGIAIVLAYRRRSPRAIGWAIAGCLAACAASLAQVLSGRLSLLGGGGVEDVLDRMDGWALARFALLALGIVLLIVAAVVDRGREGAGGLPAGLLAIGVLLAIAGVAIGAIPIHLETEREWLRILVDVLQEAARFAALGAGVLVLAVAAVARRPADDGRAEPSEILARIARAGWEYARSRERGADSSRR